SCQQLAGNISSRVLFSSCATRWSRQAARDLQAGSLCSPETLGSRFYFGPNKKLFRLCRLLERWRSMNFHFLLELHIYGLTITPWKIVGWLGAGIFGARFLIQWIASERARKSVIPFGFW